MKYYTNVFIDANNLFWRSCLFAIKKKLENESNSLYSYSIRSFLERVRFFENKFCGRNHKIYLIFDNPDSLYSIRKIIDPSYKHIRRSKQIPQEFYRSIETLQEIIKSYDGNFVLCKSACCEADDLVYPLKSKVVIDKDNLCLLISADLDWARGIDEYCHWYNFVDVYTIEVFQKKYIFSPVGNSIKMYKAIHGDNSDSIDNAVPYLPKDILVDIVTKFETPDDLFKNIKDTAYPNNWKQKIKEHEKEIRINYQLVDYVLVENTGESLLENCIENISVLKKWYDMLSIPYETRMCENISEEEFLCGSKEKRKFVAG